MRVRVGAAQPLGRDVRVDLGGAQALVAEQLLDDAQVGAALEEMACELVTERVRRRALR